MKRSLRILVMSGIAAAVVAVPTISGAALSAPKDPQIPGGRVSAAAVACEWPVNATNSALQTRTVTSSEPRYKMDTAWSDLECGMLTVTVPRGMRGGLVVHVDAEVTCTGTSPDATEWCLGRVLVGGLDAFPRELEVDGSFAWAQSSTDGGAWESNAFTRSVTLECSPNHEGPCSWPVKVQVRNHAPGLSFRIDGSTVEAQTTYY